MGAAEERRISADEVRDFYNLLPRIYDDADIWHKTTHRWVRRFIAAHHKSVPITANTRILNAGSGGQDCTFPENNVFDVDITQKNLPNSERSFVADIHELPFEDSYFSASVCVGSVLNYCDAAAAIGSLARVTQSKGHIFLEFETSASWDFAFRRGFMKGATLVTTFYNHRKVRLWVYSERFIRALLSEYGLVILDSSRVHMMSPLLYRLTNSETFSTRFSCLDPLLRCIPILRRFCSNIIFFCQKS